MPKIPKIKSLHIFALAQKNMGDEIDFLPTNKHEIFLKIESITLVGCINPCPKYPEQQVYNIFAKSQRKRER